MNSKVLLRLLLIFMSVGGSLVCGPLWAQVDEDKTGAWYMYFWNVAAGERKFGLQGDIQHRNWDSGGDLDQLLIRGGLTWQPENGRGLYTLGVAHVTSEPFGPSGDAVREKRLYQEALIPQRVGRRMYLTHRLRFEQRWVDGQDFRLRGRYFFALNVPFNQDTLAAGAHYFSFYNELFVNFNKDIGNGRSVDAFDRNRFYLAYGYSIRDNLRVQFGYMQQETDDIGKGQLQFNVFHSM
ncbi:MAG: DUF2490 domain-containing protein [Gammaproteobacteria bacterium]|nr:DUF2490 domain-containing protein [Gammaproteobacteria bacterium]